MNKAVGHVGEMAYGFIMWLRRQDAGAKNFPRFSPED
jgi:hypothetical protein